MAIKEILILGDIKLRAECKDICFPLGKEDKQILADLNDTLLNFKTMNGFGRGIAAPQIGHLKNVVCINIDKPLYFINPEITYYSDETFEMMDDCFSMPAIIVKIIRSKNIKVKYYDIDGNVHHESFSGDMSELLQHEIDHLNRIMAIDRVESTLNIYSNKEWLLRYIKQ